jgi:lipid-A-disaccharide synthase
MLCLFPFELDIYRQHAMAATFVGHPLADEIPMHTDPGPARAALGLPPTAKVLALLPGSRGGEVRLLAPLFLEAARQLSERDPAIHFVLPAASEARMTQIHAELAHFPELPVTVLAGQSRQAMAAADAILLASGTATLEAMLLKRPMVVAYRMGELSWQVASRIATTRFVALPNVLAGERIVPELLQHAATPEAMVDELWPLLSEGDKALAQADAFEVFHQQLALGYADHAAAALAQLMQPDE